MNSRDELKRLLTETAYSSKGHFKTADWMKLSLAALVMVPLITSLVVAFFPIPEPYDKGISFVGVLFSCLALISVLAVNRDKAGETMADHINLGNEYLTVFKEMRVFFCGGGHINVEQIAAWQTHISELDARTSKIPVSFMGRWWSKFRIVEEMDLQWLIKPETK